MENMIYWFIFLIFTILISTFLHEVGHGLSASIKGHPVSTGFNRVGDYKIKDPVMMTSGKNIKSIIIPGILVLF